MLTIRLVDYRDAIASIQAIRRQVFQLEQGVSEALEFDGQDAIATHFLAFWNNEAVGTTRIRYLPASSVSLPPAVAAQTSETVAKIERVAVLASYRGRKIGQALMKAAIAHLNQQDISAIKLNAQSSVQDFYERLGFCSYGDPFTEAGIPHITMWYDHAH